MERLAPQRWILHADMDAFYASVEQRDRPELCGRPVIVGGLGRRGVVAAASYEARVFGIRSAMPGFKARELCPHAVFLKPDMERYAGVSRQVAAVFEEFTPDLEFLALDEAFLDISGSVRLFGGPLALARDLKQRVLDATKLTVSVGVAPNKLVAKIACTLSKPDGLLVVPEEAVSALLEPLPVRRLWGVGPALAEELTQRGIKTFRDLAKYDANALKGAFGARASLLQRMARGEDIRLVEPSRAPKSVGEEHTFEEDLTQLAHAEAILDTLTAQAEAVAHRLRRAGYRALTISLKIKLSNAHGQRASRLAPLPEPIYPLITRSFSLQTPTHDGAIIAGAARDLWRRAAVQGKVRLLGVSASNLSPGATEQLDLFDPKRGETLGHTLDAITARFGSRSIGRAVGPRAAERTHSPRRNLR